MCLVLYDVCLYKIGDDGCLVLLMYVVMVEYDV